MLNLFKKELYSSKLKNTYRLSSKHFTRNRKLPFSKVVLFMISLVKKSLQLELYSFMQIASTKYNSISTSAFNQARMKVKPELFKHFIVFLNKEFYTDNDERVILWNGFRLLGCDGSTLMLPVTKELKKKYHYNINQHTADVLIARTSLLYDLENGLILDGIISPFSKGERQLAISHIKELKNSLFNELIILDRGYPSFDMIHQLNKLEVNYVMRVKSSFSGVTKEFMESDLMELETEIKPGKNISLLNKLYNKNQSIKVRLVKVLLNSGEIELLITSLINKKNYPATIFKELYFKRWGIETLYDKLKNKLLIENFTGYSETSILQDFYCTLFLSNLQSLLGGEANEELIKQGLNNKKYEYKINTNLSIGFLKTKLISLFLEENNTEELLKELEKLFTKNLIPIRPNRSFDRDTLKYRKRKKPPITKNFKLAF
ncbi:MAG: IS4 family transposase [Bacteroidia bacterium]